MFLTPFAFAGILYFELTGRGAAANAEPFQWWIIALVGIVTAVPTDVVCQEANRINLITLGFTEYISPSITLLLGIFLFGNL
jgi:chloramphenicol-sensitive protein RarD